MRVASTASPPLDTRECQGRGEARLDEAEAARRDRDHAEDLSGRVREQHE